jgi:16S rRNA (adenine1518-N6/adenine1519-N6)-dimethyltransferase
MIRPRKRFGQHFLHDHYVIDRIIESINLDTTATLVEIGPGQGALTIPLLARAQSLHVIEIDKDLADYLENTCQNKGQLFMHRGDVLKFDFCSSFPGKLTIVGNLPYNISTPLLFHMLDQISCIEQMVFMLQKEVADRICAEPGSGDYGRLTIMIQSLCQVEHLFDVDAESFNPPPKVKSSVIRLSPARPLQTAIHDRDIFSRLVRTAFSKRRKTIRNALKDLVSEEQIIAVGVLPSARPEELSVETFARLANTIHPGQ